jgi:hypothetical protein
LTPNVELLGQNNVIWPNNSTLGRAAFRGVAFATLARRLPGLKLAVSPEELKFKEAAIYGMKELPVTW